MHRFVFGCFLIMAGTAPAKPVNLADILDLQTTWSHYQTMTQWIGWATKQSFKSLPKAPSLNCQRVFRFSRTYIEDPELKAMLHALPINTAPDRQCDAAAANLLAHLNTGLDGRLKTHITRQITAGQFAKEKLQAYFGDYPTTLNNVIWVRFALGLSLQERWLKIIEGAEQENLARLPPRFLQNTLEVLGYGDSLSDRITELLPRLDEETTLAQERQRLLAVVQNPRMPSYFQVFLENNLLEDKDSIRQMSLALLALH